MNGSSWLEKRWRNTMEPIKWVGANNKVLIRYLRPNWLAEWKARLNSSCGKQWFESRACENIAQNVKSKSSDKILSTSVMINLSK
jgi:hypothetical protein